jgi:hypothetical protein
VLDDALGELALDGELLLAEPIDPELLALGELEELLLLGDDADALPPRVLDEPLALGELEEPLALGEVEELLLLGEDADALLPKVLDDSLALGGQVQFAAPALEPLALVPPLTALPVEVPEEPAALGELDEPLALEGELPPVAALPPVEPIELPVLDGALCALGELP